MYWRKNYPRFVQVGTPVLSLPLVYTWNLIPFFRVGELTLFGFFNSLIVVISLPLYLSFLCVQHCGLAT